MIKSLFPATILGQTKRVVRSERADFQSWNRYAQVVDRTGRTRKMPNKIDLPWDVDEIGDIVADELVAFVPGEMLNICHIAGDEAVNRNDAMALCEQSIREVRAQKACTACDDADGL